MTPLGTPGPAQAASLRSALAFPAPGPGVGLVVDLGQVLEIQVGIYLRRADIGVTEELLNGAEIAAGLEHVARK